MNNLNISASGMAANRTWMEIISTNIANAKTTQTPEGGPYRNKIVTFESVLDNAVQDGANGALAKGVRVENITDDESPFVSLYYPAHPDADEKGYVSMPNVNPMQEMALMMMASRAYEANVASFNAGKEMYLKSLEIGR